MAGLLAFSSETKWLACRLPKTLKVSAERQVGVGVEREDDEPAERQVGVTGEGQDDVPAERQVGVEVGMQSYDRKLSDYVKNYLTKEG